MVSPFLIAKGAILFIIRGASLSRVLVDWLTGIVGAYVNNSAVREHIEEDVQCMTLVAGGCEKSQARLTLTGHFY